MLIETSKLITVNNYALKIEKSRTWVNKLVLLGKLTCIKIDGVKFIIIEDKNSKLTLLLKIIV